MSEKITVESFRAALAEAVEERGADYVYPKDQPGWSYSSSGMLDPHCVYQTPEGKPACIIGLAFFKLGLEAELPLNDEIFPASELLRGLGIDWGPLRVAADCAQSKQDAGGTWGEALAAFDNYIAASRAAGEERK